MGTMALVNEVHGDFVPSCSELGWVGDPKGSRLMAYEMGKLPGEVYIIARSSLTAREARLNTVQSLARYSTEYHPSGSPGFFFAQSWRDAAAISKGGWADMSKVRTGCSDRLEYLAGTLPEHFLPSVADAQAALPALLDGRYPTVLTHSDLNEVKILVSPSSGEITGVVDWPGTIDLPFGFSLYALENALGSMNDDGWTWGDDADERGQVFWDRLVEETGLFVSGPGPECWSDMAPHTTASRE
ncbi:hypothetical protein GGTG_01855 [Gaeumannomyces tritici R3-111a-1]|uniref:Uncharacterized protein n=1 Tax=Gaeumannomyces tritici (strain R3-111a-1) TaxID=644352 RepID=J3NKR4_GAET3|nr:hypothetical protein GGTG_01855 [Gaeumannomyces tritici R3-111a-1]EJT81881.1 hypothetical protein GGTG_01855 [Gaeumannomyces tritici R3-111a-1]